MLTSSSAQCRQAYATHSIPPALAYTVLKDAMKYWYQTNYSLENESYLMSQKTWSKLKPADQKIIFDAVTKVAAKSIDQAKKDDAHYMDLMRKKGSRSSHIQTKNLLLSRKRSQRAVKLEANMARISWMSSVSSSLPKANS